MATDTPTFDPIGEINKYDFRNEEHYVFKARKGLNREIVAEISEMKNEPAWMRDFRLKAWRSSTPSRCRTGAATSPSSSTTSTTTSSRPTTRSKSWDDVPDGNQEHLRQAGHSRGREEIPGRREGPVRERSRLRLAAAKSCRKQGVIFTDTDYGRPRASRAGARVFRHDHPADRQQVRRAEFGRLVGRIVRLRAAGREDRVPACRPISASTPRTWASSSGR